MGFDIKFGGKGRKSGLDQMAEKTPGKNSIIPKHKMEYENEEKTLESDLNEEVEQTVNVFSQIAKAEMDKRLDNTSEEFYSCLVFNNEDQRRVFFKKLGLKISDKQDLRFINGIALAKAMGIELPPSNSNEAGKFKVNKELLSFCMNPKPAKNEG